jgi:hypothetical protein
VGSSERGTGPSSSIKYFEILEQLSDRWLPKKKSLIGNSAVSMALIFSILLIFRAETVTRHYF